MNISSEDENELEFYDKEELKIIEYLLSQLSYVKQM
jgi:hypothetical protein